MYSLTKGYRKEKMDTIPEIGILPRKTTQNRPKIAFISWDNVHSPSTTLKILVIGFGLMVAFNCALMSGKLGVISVEPSPGNKNCDGDNKAGCNEVKIVPYCTPSSIIVGILNFGTGAAIALIRSTSKSHQDHWNSMLFYWMSLNGIMVVLTSLLVLLFRMNFELISRASIMIWQTFMFYTAYQYVRHRPDDMTNKMGGKRGKQKPRRG